MSNHIDQFDHARQDNIMASDKQLCPDVIEYQKVVEEILVWLFERENMLNQRPDEISLTEKSFSEVLEEYSIHEKFITEFYNYGTIVMKCKEDGLELRDNRSLSEEDHDEVGIQIDTMMVCYEKLKILAADRLNFIKRILEERQRTKIERFKEWLSNVEKRMSHLNNIGPDGNAIQRQLQEVNILRAELEQKQNFLDFMSNFVVFDEIDTDSLQIRSRSCESLTQRLEDVNTRWQDICKFVNDRTCKLQAARSIWDLLESEGPQLASWLKRVENNLDELSEAASGITDCNYEQEFITKLHSRSNKLDSEIKNKQTFYSSLEHRVRGKIEAIDDNYSMLVIELEKALEGMQENWNSMMYHKRMLDYKLHALSHPITGPDNRNMIPLPEPITCSINYDNGQSSYPTHDVQDTAGKRNELLNLHNIVNDDKESSLQICNSSLDSKTLDDVLSPEKPPLDCIDMRRSMFNEELATQDDISTESLTDSFPINLTSSIRDDFSSSLGRNNNGILEAIPISPSDLINELPNNINVQNHGNTQQGCRVEEWKHILESFSSWLKRVETSLGIDEAVLNEDRRVPLWSQSDPHQQLLTLVDVERQINSTCQDEFDCLILQGQQIIADLIPEIGENGYEANLKEILSDIELRYSALKRCLDERKRDLSNRDRWLDLSKRLKNSSRSLIDEMGQIIPKTEIGVDLITLAQQQDRLIRSKTDLSNNILIQSNIQDAKMFLRLCDALQQQVSQNPVDEVSQQFRLMKSETDIAPNTISDIWFFLKELRGEIENQLDKLTLHYSELSQLIDDRLERLDEVHKEVHALQHSMQELAAQLQVAEILKSKWENVDNLSIEQLSEQLEDLKLYRERMTEVASTHDTMNSIFEWMTESDVPLSQQNLKRISELNTIWSLIQVSIDERQKHIELAFDNHGASEQKFLTQSLCDMPNWERRVAASKVPYFVDHSSNKTKWDHPKFTDLLNSMNSIQQVVFSAYRTALKLRFVQRQFGIDLLMLEHLKEIFNGFNFSPSTSESITVAPNNPVTDALVGVEQIISLLQIIYERIQREEKKELNIPLSIDLTLNWLLNLYDSTRTGFVSVLSLKVGLALICCATREEKYIFMYDLIVQGKSQGVDGRRLGTLFEICIRIPIYLGEGSSFGGTEIIEKSIRDCFADSKFNPDHPNCIDIADYLSWLKSEPKFIIWLPVLHRLLVSENKEHDVKCKICKAYPMIGLRYRCLRCFNYNICQNCFLTGRHINEHLDPAKHLMQEYCSATSSGDNMRDLSKIIRNKLKPKPLVLGG